MQNIVERGCSLGDRLDNVMSLMLLIECFARCPHLSVIIIKKNKGKLIIVLNSLEG